MFESQALVVQVRIPAASLNLLTDMCEAIRAEAQVALSSNNPEVEQHTSKLVKIAKLADLTVAGLFLQSVLKAVDAPSFAHSLIKEMISE